jgi:hypothetical protein
VSKGLAVFLLGLPHLCFDLFSLFIVELEIFRQLRFAYTAAPGATAVDDGTALGTMEDVELIESIG